MFLGFLNKQKLENFIWKVTWRDYLVTKSGREWLGNTWFEAIWEIVIQPTRAACSTPLLTPVREQYGSE